MRPSGVGGWSFSLSKPCGRSAFTHSELNATCALRVMSIYWGRGCEAKAAVPVFYRSSLQISLISLQSL
jgi:hypothetical protein